MSTSLKSLVDSQDIGDKIRAGRVIAALRDPALGLIDRKSEAITLPERGVNRRVLEIELRPQLAIRSLPIGDDIEVDVIPIALLPKQVYLSFDTFDDTGASLPLVTRRENARVAMAHLLYSAMTGRPGLEPPSPAMVEFIGDCVGRFPSEFPPDLPFAARVRRLGKALPSVDDRDWLNAALAIPGWPKLFVNYHESFLAIPRAASLPGQECAVARIEYLETRVLAGPPGLRERLRARTAMSKTLSFRINELGRARSDSISLEAPEGTFLLDGALHQLGHDAPSTEYRVRPSRSRYSLYVRRRTGPEPRAASLTAELWPTPAGFLLPLNLLSFYGALISFLFFLFSVVPDLASELFEERDAALGALVFLPTLTAAWVFRTDDLPFKHSVVATSRWRSGYVVAGIWLAFSASFFRGNPVLTTWTLMGKGMDQHILTALYLAIAAYCTYVRVTVMRLTKRIMQAFRTGKTLEMGPKKGLSVSVSPSPTDADSPVPG